jgi:DNA repair exonuclease SbcCD nuclease subunit
MTRPIKNLKSEKLLFPLAKALENFRRTNPQDDAVPIFTSNGKKYQYKFTDMGGVTGFTLVKIGIDDNSENFKTTVSRRKINIDLRNNSKSNNNLKRRNSFRDNFVPEKNSALAKIVEDTTYLDTLKKINERTAAISKNYDLTLDLLLKSSEKITKAIL